MSTHAPTQAPQFSVPTGTVTLLLADIEGSVRLWEAKPKEMREAIARHDEIVTRIIGLHGGVRPGEQGEGDSFVAAFARPSDALAGALELQLAITKEDWPPDLNFRLRIGVHTGEVQLRDQGNYVGQAINRCARLREIAHGGQTLLSAATRDLVLDRMPDKATLEDLGSHRLRDLARPEHVYELKHPDLVQSFPPLRSLDSFAHNLPIQLTSFVGRQSEISEVRNLLRETRLLSLVGSGGSGKSRLALQVAANVLDDYPDGVWLVDLAPIRDPELVPKTLASTISVGEEGSRKLSDTIANRIGSKQMLVILDNCEHLVTACAELADGLLRSCPSLTLLTTTRERLGVPGETSWRVPSLSTPKKDQPPPQIEVLTQFEAVQLFIERGLKARPNFKVTNENAAAVAEICYRLDGIPLAIELAAARVRALTPQEISEGLSDRFHLLTGGSRTVVPRQQTLEASVDWGYDLLRESERTLLQRLSVFAGGFNLDAAEAVCANGGVSQPDVLDVLFDLVDKSMVVAEEEGSASRFRLLETVRQYAGRRLNEAGEEEETRTRHRDFFLELVSTLDFKQGEADAMRQLEIEHDNIRAALNWTKERGDYQELLELVSAMTYYWRKRGYYREGLAWIEDIATRGDQPRTWQLGRVKIGLGWTYWLTGEYSKIPDLVREGLHLLRAADDPRAKTTIPYAHVLDAWVTRLPGSPETIKKARELHEEAVASARGTESKSALLFALQYLGWHLEFMERNLDLASAPYLEALNIAEQIDDPAAVPTMGLARMLERDGDLPGAVAMGEKAVSGAREDVGGLVQALQGLAWLYFAIGDYGRMRLQGEEMVKLVQGSPMWESQALVVLANASFAEADFERAEELWSELARRRETVTGQPAHFELGLVSKLNGDTESAVDHLEQALEAARAGRDQFGSFRVLGSLLGLHRSLGDVARGEAIAHEYLLDRAGDYKEYPARARINPGVARALREIAACAADQESFIEAARLFGAADALTEQSPYARPPGDDYEREIARLRASMDRVDFEEAWAEGRSMSIENMISYAQRGRGERKRPSIGWASLTPTEVRVAELVAQGLTNPEIGERMFVSSRTIQTHVKHVFAKLGLSKRAELAAQWTRRESKQGLST